MQVSSCVTRRTRTRTSQDLPMRWVPPDRYSWRCSCGKPAFVQAFEGDTPCRECWMERRLAKHVNEL